MPVDLTRRCQCGTPDREDLQHGVDHCFVRSGDHFKRLMYQRTNTLRERAERAEAEIRWLRSVLARWGIEPGQPPVPATTEDASPHG